MIVCGGLQWKIGLIYCENREWGIHSDSVLFSNKLWQTWLKMKWMWKINVNDMT